MTRLASIDIGTNSVLLLVAERSGDTLTPVEEACEITRLGQGVDARRELAHEAMVRTLDVVARFAARARALGAEPIRIAGTSALRDAANGRSFVAAVRERVGIELSIIDGEAEARLIVAGVETSFGRLSAGSLVFDVGGGSTELIAVGEGGRVDALRSLDIGAVRLTERFVRGDPPPPRELEAAAAAIDAELEVLPPTYVASYQRARSPRLVGVSGTVTTLHAIEEKMVRYDPRKVDGATLTVDAVEALIARLASMPLERRKRLAGLEPRRADVIIAGALIVAAVMRLVGADALHVADRGVRWGLLSSVDVDDLGIA